MSEQQSSYRSIFKATSLFGGVQVFNILISIIKSKVIAIYLGASGVGIMSLFQSALDTIAYLTNMGLSVSAVRSISEANDTGDETRIRRVVTTFRRWLWLTGVLGAVVTFCLSPWLSQWSFGNKDYTLSFMWLSVTLLLGALSGGQITLLQGMRKITYMAKSSIIGSTLGLFISLPLYYEMGIKGIVPTFILSSILSLVLTIYFSRKLKIEKSDIELKESFHEGLGMVKLGVLITTSSFLSMLSAYLINIFITHVGSLSDVGLYQGGTNITNKYVGLVFSAMVVDYYPRLAGVSKNKEKVNEVVNQQTELTLLILAPILILLLSTTPLVIRLFYTKEFLPIVIFVQWVVLGMMFKAVSWSLGFIVLAKGDSKLYFYKEIVTLLILLICNMAGYYFWGLEGLGISFLVGFVLVYLFVYQMVYARYEFRFTKGYIYIFTTQFALCIVAFLLAYFLKFPWAYFTGVILFGITGWISFHEVDKRMDVKQIIRTKIMKKLGKK